MKTPISYKNVIKASLATVFLVTAFFAVLIWVFGGRVNLETELSKVPVFNPIEKFEKASNPLDANLTEDLSTIIAKELVDKNPQGPQLGEDGLAQIASINPDQLVAQTIEEGLRNFDLNKLKGSVDPTLLNITEENTVEKKGEYFSRINEIIETTFKGNSIDVSNPALINFSSISEKYGKIVGAFYAEETPSDLEGFALSLIETFETQKNVYASIAIYEEDPLQALIAIELGNETVSQIIDIFVDMTQYIESNDIEKHITSSKINS